jgi:hypothetical protein
LTKKKIKIENGIGQIGNPKGIMAIAKIKKANNARE